MANNKQEASVSWESIVNIREVSSLQTGLLGRQYKNWRKVYGEWKTAPRSMCYDCNSVRRVYACGPRADDGTG